MDHAQLLEFDDIFQTEVLATYLDEYGVEVQIVGLIDPVAGTVYDDWV